MHKLATEALHKLEANVMHKLATAHIHAGHFSIILHKLINKLSILKYSSVTKMTGFEKV